MFAGYYEQPRDVDEVIELVGLGEKRDARVKTLSGGQKRRLDLGVALVGDPDLVFLDEPTTGFDPTARRTAWDLVRSLRSLGKTILLTTHYLDEAQQLADRVAVIREGQLVRIGTPHELIGVAPKVEIRYREGRARRRRRDRRADARARRADRRGGRRGAGARGARGAAADPRGRLPRPRRRRRRATVSVLVHELRMQQLMFWRNRESAVFVFVFPPMLFLLLGAVYDGTIDGVPAADRLLVGMLGYGCANTAFGGLAITLVVRRELGILKRLRATPLPAATYLAAVLVSTLIVFFLQMLLTVALGLLLYDAQGAESWFAVVPVLLLGGIAFAGLGFGVASLIRSAEGSSAVVNLIILPMAFLSGSFGPTSGYPQVLQTIADVLPLTYLIDLIEASYLHGEPLTDDPGARRGARRLGRRGVRRRGPALRLGAARALTAAPPSTERWGLAYLSLPTFTWPVRLLTSRRRCRPRRRRAVGARARRGAGARRRGRSRRRGPVDRPGRPSSRRGRSDAIAARPRSATERRS